MKRLFLLLLFACQPHPTGAEEVAASDCYSCHQPDYDGTTNPHHATVGYGTSCSDCHSTTAWIPANIGHPESRFPIKSGRHSGIACGDCHDRNAGSDIGGANVSCIGCHTHSRANTDGRHDGVDGYSWDASHPHFCLRCHPSGGHASGD